MADPLWPVTIIYEPTGTYNCDRIGGLPLGGGASGDYGNWNSYGSETCQSNGTIGVDSPSVSGGRWIFTGGHMILRHISDYLDGSWNQMRWAFSDVFPGEWPTFTMDTHILVSNDGVIYDNSTANPNYVLAEYEKTIDGNYSGTFLEVRANRLYVTSLWNDTEYDTGLDFSGRSHLLIQYKQYDDYFIVGLNGDTFVVPVPWTAGYGDAAWGGSIDSYSSPYNTGNASGVGFSGEMSKLRLTSRVLRFEGLGGGIGTYTPPAEDFVGEDSGSSPMSASVSWTPDEYGTAYDQSPSFRNNAFPVYTCYGVTGGTPPYTYEWVDFFYGRLEFAANWDGTDKATVQLDTGAMSEIHPYWVGCIVRDSAGNMCTTLEVQQGTLESYDEPIKLGETEYYANIGDTVRLRGNAILKSQSKHNHTTDNAPFNVSILSVTPPDAEGTLTKEQEWSRKLDDGPASGPAEVGAKDVFIIDSVTAAHNGLTLDVYSYFPIEGSSRVYLVVNDAPPLEEGFGWWTDVEEAEQDILVGFEAAMETWDEGVAKARADIAADDWDDRKDMIESWIYSFDYPENRAHMTEGVLAYIMCALVEGYEYEPWTWYETTPSTRVTAWDFESLINGAYAAAFDRAYWQMDFGGPTAGPTFLPETGSEYQIRFNAVHAGCHDGWHAAKKDIANADSKNTTSYYPYSGPYAEEYEAGFDDMYEQSWALG